MMEKQMYSKRLDGQPDGGIIQPIVYRQNTLEPNKVVDISTSAGSRIIWLISENTVFCADNGYIFRQVYQMPVGVTLTSIKHFTKNQAFLLGYNEQEISTVLYVLDTQGNITLRHQDISQHYKANGLTYNDVSDDIKCFCVIYNKNTTREIVFVNVQELDADNPNPPLPAWTARKINYNRLLSLPKDVPGILAKTGSVYNLSADSFVFANIFDVKDQFYFDSTEEGGRIYPAKVCGLSLYIDDYNFFANSLRTPDYVLAASYGEDASYDDLENPGLSGITSIWNGKVMLYQAGTCFLGYEENNTEERYNGVYFTANQNENIPVSSVERSTKLICMDVTPKNSVAFIRSPHFVFSSNTETLYCALEAIYDIPNTRDQQAPKPQPLPIKSNTFGSVANTKKLAIYKDNSQYIQSFYGINAQDQGFVYISGAISAISDLIEMYDRRYMVGISPTGDLVKCDLTRGGHWTKKNISEGGHLFSLPQPLAADHDGILYIMDDNGNIFVGSSDDLEFQKIPLNVPVQGAFVGGLLDDGKDAGGGVATVFRELKTEDQPGTGIPVECATSSKYKGFWVCSNRLNGKVLERFLLYYYDEDGSFKLKLKIAFPFKSSGDQESIYLLAVQHYTETSALLFAVRSDAAGKLFCNIIEARLDGTYSTLASWPAEYSLNNYLDPGGTFLAVNEKFVSIAHRFYGLYDEKDFGIKIAERTINATLNFQEIIFNQESFPQEAIKGGAIMAMAVNDSVYATRNNKVAQLHFVLRLYKRRPDGLVLELGDYYYRWDLNETAPNTWKLDNIFYPSPQEPLGELRRDLGGQLLSQSFNTVVFNAKNILILNNKSGADQWFNFKNVFPVDSNGIIMFNNPDNIVVRYGGQCYQTLNSFVASDENYSAPTLINDPRLAPYNVRNSLWVAQKNDFTKDSMAFYAIYANSPVNDVVGAYFARTTSSVSIAASEGGKLLISYDNWKSWKTKDVFYPQDVCKYFSRDPSNHGVLYAVTHSNNNNLYKLSASAEDGWGTNLPPTILVETPGTALTYPDTRSPRVNSSDEFTHVAAYKDIIVVGLNNGTIRFSVDGGITWNANDTLPEADIKSLTIDNKTELVYVVVDGYGLFFNSMLAIKSMQPEPWIKADVPTSQSMPLIGSHLIDRERTLGVVGSVESNVYTRKYED
jgi:hypothetical protein